MRGPRQVGKTTLQYQLIEALLGKGVDPERILRVQFDELPTFRAARSPEPVLDMVRWFADRFHGGDLNAAARAGRPALIFLDEVQNLADWSVQLKSLVDHTDVRVLVTGSSALRIERGRDSLAGRIQMLDVGPFRLSEIAAVRGFGSLPPFAEPNGSGNWAKPEFWRDLEAHGRKHASVRNKSFEAFSERGGYPLAQRPDLEWPEVARQLNETVVRRVIQHDLRVGARGRRRDPQLLETVFRLGARYCGQAPSLGELTRQARSMQESDVGPNRIRAYLDFLDSALLLRSVPPLEMRLSKRHGAAKLCLSDHALRAAWLDEVVPLDDSGLRAAPELQDLAGRVAESTAGYYLSEVGLPVAHIPARSGSPEIDFLLTAGDWRVPLEVKYRRTIEVACDMSALQSFVARPTNRARVGVVVTRNDYGGELPDHIVALPLKSLLLAH